MMRQKTVSDKTGSNCLAHSVCSRLYLLGPSVLHPVSTGHRICPALPRAHSLALAQRNTPRAAAHGLLARQPKRPASAQNDISELVAHSGRVLPADNGSFLAGSVSLLDSAMHNLVGTSLARALQLHGREVHVGREGLPLQVRTPVAWVSVAVCAAWPREPSPTRLRQEGLCPPQPPGDAARRLFEGSLAAAPGLPPHDLDGERQVSDRLTAEVRPLGTRAQRCHSA